MVPLTESINCRIYTNHLLPVMVIENFTRASRETLENDNGEGAKDENTRMTARMIYR